MSEKGFLEYLRKSSPSPFLLKTYMLVEDPATDNVISWNGDGTGFVVWQPAEFSSNLLPTFFKHRNFSSFVRQLNTYGFRKIATGRWEFCNDRFRKGGRELLCEIRRRKALTNNNKQKVVVQARVAPQECDEDQRSSSTSSSSGHVTLLDENKRLKKENEVLSTELTSMKNKCKELHDLVGKYSHLEKEEKERPKLFGVRLEIQGEGEEKGNRRN